MLRLHDRTRRRICVAGFFLLCILPTVLVAGWCVAWHLPGHVSAEARRLTRQLGLDVTLEGLRHLRPGVVLYEGLELADPETGRSVLRCRLLEARRTKTADQQGQPQTSLVLIASQPEIDSWIGSGSCLGGCCSARPAGRRWTCGWRPQKPPCWRPKTRRR